MKKIAIILVTFWALLGCSKDLGLQLNTTEVVMFSLDEHVITTNGTNVSFVSRDEFVATVNKTTGKITGKHVGETVIDVVGDQGSNSVKVTIKPKYHVLIDPIINWGASRADIEKQCGKADETSDGNLIYFYGNANNNDKHIGTFYLFDNGKLKNIMIVPNNKYLDDVLVHLAERYQYVGFQEGMYAFTDSMELEEAKTNVATLKLSGQWVVMYQKANL